MRDRLRKRSHHWLGIDRVTPVNRARNTAIVVKSGKKYILGLLFDITGAFDNVRWPLVFKD